MVGEYGHDADNTVETSELRSLVSPSSKRQLDDYGNDGSWPEFAALLRRDIEITPNYLLAMFFAGLWRQPAC